MSRALTAPLPAHEAPAAATSEPKPKAFAFDDVYAAHGAFVWRVLRRLGVHEADVADVAQEVFLVVHRRLGSFDGACAVQTWLFAICQRTASGYRRRAHRKHETLAAETPEVASEPGQADAVAERQARALLDRALDALDEDQRAVFVLFELEQLAMTEVAAMAGCPLKTAYSRLYAARARVTEAVERAARAQKGGAR